MSDDRMDRAERIRNMREGNRSTDQTDDATTADPDEGTESAATDDTGTSSDPSPASGSDTGFSSLTSEDDEPTTGASSSASATGSDTSAADAATAASGAAEAGESTTTADGADGGASSDAQAAAQRAAQSAAEATGAGLATETGTETRAAADAETGSDGPAVPAGATGASTVPGDVSGVELPDQQLLEEAMATSGVESTEGGARAAMEGESAQSEEVVRVLEFSLGDEYYCLDIEYVEEIVKRNAVTRVPNTPEFVDGVVDLRGQITTILEPKEMMDIESAGDQNLIIVFDPEQFEDQGAIGWVVDEVRQVVPVTESEVNTPPVDAEYINGVVDREEYDQFVIWVEPEDALAQATATEED